jgi:tripartite-type tricarboxylate transporter receptor subunit TctC
VVHALKSPEVIARLRADGAEPVGSTPDEFVKFIRAETKKWAEVVKSSGARVD